METYVANMNNYNGVDSMKRFVKRILGGVVMVSMLCSIMPSVGTSAELVKSKTIKTVEIDLNKASNGVTYTNSTKATKVLKKDYASSNGEVGTIYSYGQIVDFSRAIPKGSVIENVTVYCPRDVKVTQSKYTTIKNYCIENINTGTDAIVPFQQTDSPSSTNQTTVFKKEEANTQFLIRIEGKILRQVSGIDGFTVFGGKIIVSYRE